MPFIDWPSYTHLQPDLSHYELIQSLTLLEHTPNFYLCLLCFALESVLMVTGVSGRQFLALRVEYLPTLFLVGSPGSLKKDLESVSL